MIEKLSNKFEAKDDTFKKAQYDMCQAYANGSIGVIVSGLIWLITSFISHQYSPSKAIGTLFFGGMFIFPLSMLLCKSIGLSGTHTKGNPLGNLAMEGTILMMMCLPLALGLSIQQKEWFFQAMLLIIGGRYLTFATIYGKKVYWILGTLLGISALILFKLKVQSLGSLLTGSCIEISFGLFMLISFRRDNKKSQQFY
ncbi:DUF7010 family protein [Aquirufa salirivi]|uniref:DUF308 domain-containing protein n=1 Tax=Aquirufa salirivi TaxID=3104729 RepID=A0ABW8RUS9_9BACT